MRVKWLPVLIVLGLVILAVSNAPPASVNPPTLPIFSRPVVDQPLLPSTRFCLFCLESQAAERDKKMDIFIRHHTGENVDWWLRLSDVKEESNWFTATTVEQRPDRDYLDGYGLANLEFEPKEFQRYLKPGTLLHVVGKIKFVSRGYVCLDPVKMVESRNP